MMPLYRFKTHQEARESLWNFHPDSKYYESLKDLFDFASHILPASCERGIKCYATIEEAQDALRKSLLKNATGRMQ